MGSWAVDAFGNDTACDWAYTLEKSRDFSVIQSAIQAALLPRDEYLDSDPACEALAACEVIARLKGKWGVRNSHSEAADNWVRGHSLQPTGDLIHAASSAIDRILDENSELRDLWNEADGSEWRESVEELRSRLLA